MDNLVLHPSRLLVGERFESHGGGCYHRAFWCRVREMGFSQSFHKAAHRHLKAGQILYKNEGGGDRPACWAVAGYLFGLAGELAVKEIMRNSGMKTLPMDQRRDDPFFSHFPNLKVLLAISAQGRRQGELRKFSEDSCLFQNWDISMRYAPTTEIMDHWVHAWKKSAEELINTMRD